MKFNWQKLLRIAVYEYDIPPAEFWEMTFGELASLSNINNKPRKCNKVKYKND